MTNNKEFIVNLTEEGLFSGLWVNWNPWQSM